MQCYGFLAQAETLWSSCRPILVAAKRTVCWPCIICFLERARQSYPDRNAFYKRSKALFLAMYAVLWWLVQKFAPGSPARKDDGTVVRTIWGEIAWQLGGREGYNMCKTMTRTPPIRATGSGSCSTVLRRV